MTVERNESGRRFVQAEIEVPGTPEEVWRAIATGRGISSWFVPTDVDERVGGEVKATFGPGMDSLSKITAWEPPHRTVSESQDLGPDAPTVATEWTVEARDGGTCIVRVVHSLFTDATDWDGELDAWADGWPDFFRILRLYLEHFQGRSAAMLDLSASTTLPPADAWSKLCAPLGLLGTVDGEDRRVEVDDLPTLDVHAEFAGKPPHPELLLVRTGEPMPGLAHLFTLKLGEQTIVSVRFYIYGDDPAAAVQRVEPAWRAWLERQFPPST